MRPNSTNLSDKPSVSNQQSAISKNQNEWRWLLVAGCWLLVAVLTGCESFQQKFVRKSKTPKPPPTPIISFQDYTRTMTPLDRYRKHYMMFDYWNAELLETLQATPLNPKRFKRASNEALEEFKTMQTLVVEDVASRMTPLLEERTKINTQLQEESFSPSLVNVLRHALEVQQRQIHSDFFWREVQEKLKPQPGNEAATPGS